MTIESELALFRQAQALATLPSPEEFAEQETEEKAHEPQLLTPNLEEGLLPIPIAPEAPIANPVMAIDSPEVALSPAPPSLGWSEDIADNLTPAELALFRVNAGSDTTIESVGAELDQQEAVLEPTTPSPSSQERNTVVGAPLSADAEGDHPNISKLDPAIEDYLDSSTALRQHLEESMPVPETNPEPSKFSPQKLVQFGALTVLGTLVVALFLNVTGLSKKLRPSPVPQLERTPPSSSEAISPQSQLTASPIPTATSPRPKLELSSPEVAEVNSGNLSPSQPSASVPMPSNSSNAGTAVPATPVASVQSPVPQEPIPVITEETAQSGGLFYVMLPYTNPSSLTQAQQWVPTAFLTEGTGGQQIQMGALETMDAAQTLAQQLRTRGLSASIIAPN
ncbi:MAG: SPOR domain-containing protein [Acaryochloris sp. RU_4_1]|nr:SPOR domain-containing protein [Acaryochloris sp. RU_4_1]NJR54683.1 SPOR domain-containing protein [Acaryochloris sp. CRU_2_0]